MARPTHLSRCALTGCACFSQCFHGDRDAFAEQLRSIVPEDAELHIEPEAWTAGILP